MKRRDFLKSAAAVAAGSAIPAPAVWSPAKAQSRQETLLIVSESGPNNLDIHGVGTNVPGYEVSWNCYDRLISHEMKTLPNGTPVLRPRQVQAGARRGHERRRHVGHLQAAQEREVPGRHAGHRQGREVVVRSRGHGRRLPDLPDEGRLAGEARAVRRRRRPHLPRRLPAQGQADDPRSRGDRAVRSINSELVKKNATEKDPWGLEYTKHNTAGSGAYRVDELDAGTEVVFERNDDWKSRPAAARSSASIWRMVPSAGNRRALLERGDADISYDLPNKDFVELKQSGKLSIIVDADRERHPVHRHERHQAAVRQSQGPPGGGLRHPLPEDHGRRAVRARQADVRRGAGDADRRSPGRSRTRYNTDIAKAKQLLAEAGYPERLRDHALVRSGLCRRQRAALRAGAGEPRRRSASRRTINKIPGANWRTELNKKVMPLYTNVFSGWLDYPEYFFFWCYHGQNSVFNTMSYQSPGDGRLDRRRRDAAAVGDKAAYEKDVKGFVDHRLRRRAAHPAVPALRSTWRCRRTSPATSTGSTAGSTTARSRRR